jgi:hypothetical protein
MLDKPFHAMEGVNYEFMHLLHITLVVKILNEAI